MQCTSRAHGPGAEGVGRSRPCHALPAVSGTATGRLADEAAEEDDDDDERQERPPSVCLPPR